MANSLLKTVAGRIGMIVGGSVIGLGLWVGLGGAMSAAPRVPDAQTCLPTCDIDGRSFVVAGNDPTTLSAQAITIGLVYTNAEPVVNFEIFDADHQTNWDTPLQCGMGCADNNSPAPLIALSLYRDPAGDGSGVTPVNLIATWTPGGVPGLVEQGAFAATNNTWALDTVAHDPAAVGLDLNFHYALVISPFSPATNKGWNAFKIRANGTVTLLGNQIVGFIAAMNPQFDLTTIYPAGFPNQAGTPYNGKWIFVTTLPPFLGDVTVFDGDMDFGNAACEYNDTNDPDSDPANPNSAFFPTGIPPFAIGSAAAPEGVAVATNPDPNIVAPLLCNGTGPGVRTGTPAEDAVATSANLRVPTIVPNGIAYLLRAPDGQVFLNPNPSGNKEWEQFKIQKVNNAADIPGAACPVGGFAQSGGFTLPDNPNDNLYPASDCRTLVLPGGNWQVELDGMDLQNLNFWFFSFKVEPPNDTYSIGRLVWRDNNSNGVQDGGELGIPGVLVNVYDGPLPGGNFVTAGVTDGNGEFLFDPVAPGNYTIEVDASNFGVGQPLNGLTSTTGGEVQDGIEVGLPVCTDTNVPVGCGQPIYDEALFGYNAEEGGGGETSHTNATCQDYIGGTLDLMPELFYSLSGNNIGNVTPGAMFFWTTVTVGAGQTLTIQQSHTGTGAGILGLHGNQARILTTNCALVTNWGASQNATTGEISFPAVGPGTYVVQVKFAPKSLQGKPKPNPATIFYTFVAALNGVPQPLTANDPALALTKK